MGAGIKGSFPLEPAESTRNYGVRHASICRFSVRIFWMTVSTLIALGIFQGLGSQVFASAPFDSQGSVTIDVRWVPWIGSWRLVSNTVNRDDRDLKGDYRLEVSPTDRGSAVTMKTFEDDSVLFEDLIIADGISQPLKDKECSGWYKYSWSDTGKRLLFESESRCPDKPVQNISGISVINRNEDWVDIQLLRNSQDRIITVRRYSLVSDQTKDFAGQGVGIAMAGRLKAGKNFSVDEIIELSGTVPEEVLEAALMEFQEPFDINSKTLQRLADAEVSTPVIDLMVALSFPEKFYIERDTVSILAAGNSGSGKADVIYSSPYYSRYSIVDPFFPWYWTPSTYALYWNYGWDIWPGVYYPYYYDYYSSGSSGGFQQRHDSGRLVAGRGYTRVRSRDSSSAPSGNAARRSASGGRVSNVGSTSSSRSSARANSSVAPSGSGVSYGSSGSSGSAAPSSGGGSASSGASYGSSGGSSSGGSSGYSGGSSPSASPGGYSGGGGSGGSAHSR